MREPTVAAIWPKALVAFAASRGADRGALMRMAGIAPLDLTDSSARVPLARYVALLEASIELCNDTALPLKFGEHVPIDELSDVALVVANAASAEEGQAKMNRYIPLMMDDGEESSAPRMDFVHRSGKIWIRLASPIYARHPIVTEAAMARAVSSVRRMSRLYDVASTTELFPEEIHFTWTEPAHRAEYDRLFGVPLVFGSDTNAFVVNAAFLSARMPQRFSAAVPALMAHADELLARLDRSTSLRARVDDELLRSFESGDVRMAKVAQQLGMSRATLLRRLRADGTTFAEVLENLRHERALRLLNEEKRSVSQTAHLLGFSDPAAFSRAFKRWTGVSPRDALHASASTRDRGRARR